MKKQRRPAVIILSLACATLLATLLWRKESHSRDEDRTAQRRAFKAASSGDLDEMRARTSLSPPPLPRRADGTDETEPGRKPATLQVVLHEVTRLAEGERQAEARREFLSDATLWQEPHSAKVADAAKALERACARWADAWLQPAGESMASFKMMEYREARRRLDELLADLTQLTPDAGKKLKSLEAGNWDKWEEQFLDAAHFKAMTPVTAAGTETASAPATRETRAAGDFRVGRYDGARELLSQLLALEMLHVETATEREQERAGESPVVPEATVAEMRDAINRERGEVLRELRKLHAAAAAEEEEWRSKKWEGYQFKHGGP